MLGFSAKISHILYSRKGYKQVTVNNFGCIIVEKMLVERRFQLKLNRERTAFIYLQRIFGGDDSRHEHVG